MFTFTSNGRGITHTAYDIKETKEIIDSSDCKFFSKITHPGHCLHHLLLQPLHTAHCPYRLREGQHYYELHNIEFSQYKTCFINQCLFRYR